MGKMVTFLTILICLDLLFLLTGQIVGSPSSIVFNSIINLESADLQGFFKDLVGDIGSLFTSATGILALIAGAATVATGFFLSVTDTKLFIPIATSLGLLASDFVFLASRLTSINLVLGTIIMSPIIIIYMLTVVEWLRNKD